MHRFYCEQLPGLDVAAVTPAASVTVELDEGESHHALRVLRLEAGAAVELMDGAGRLACGVITGAAGSRAHPRVTVRVTGVRQVAASRPTIDLAVAAPKGSRLEDIAPVLSQLNVATLIPLRTARGVADPRPARLDRLQRAAIESAKQCGRAHLMRIAPAATLNEALALGHDVRWIAMPQAAGAAGRSGPQAAASRLTTARRVLILIGPEGGWTDDEVAQALRAGCEPWAMGANILRIETAAAAAAAIAGYLALER